MSSLLIQAVSARPIPVVQPQVADLLSQRRQDAGPEFRAQLDPLDALRCE